MLKQKYFLTDFFILSAEKQPIKSLWRKIEWLRNSFGIKKVQHFTAYKFAYLIKFPYL